MEKIYLKALENLKQEAASIANSHFMAMGKVLMLVVLNMRYELIMIDRNLDVHPYLLVDALINEALVFLKGWRQIGFIENKTGDLFLKQAQGMEQEHRDLFQRLWVEFNPQQYEERIRRYVHRLRINDLGNGWLNKKRCIDFGCGHGNFAHALIREGAGYACGLDYGKDSIEYAIKARDRLGISPAKIEFKVESVYRVSGEDNSFDFAVQNGVFHHLENEDKAIAEVRRVLKPGGWFWIYTDGSGAISHDLWDASVYILQDIPRETILSILGGLNLSVGKRYHLGDALNAIYRHASWDGLTQGLKNAGFGNFRRLRGGFETDFDHDVIAADKYGRDKFGEGDLRLLAQKI